MELDRVDRQIIRELQRDARQSNSSLAATVGLSESACLRRVRLLEQAGVITRYTAVLSGTKIGFTIGFIVRITLKMQTDRDLSAFEHAVEAVPEITQCDLTTGESDYVLRVVARDAADFERIHSKVLTKLPGVARVESSFVLRPIIKDAGLPVDL